MTATANTLPVAIGRPFNYLPLQDEPTFDAGQNLALEMLTECHATGTILSLDGGYTAT